jgi:hypothetical protein
VEEYIGLIPFTLHFFPFYSHLKLPYLIILNFIYCNSIIRNSFLKGFSTIQKYSAKMQILLIKKVFELCKILKYQRQKENGRKEQ